jgi:ABC-type antimicrobial peptide transport system permease subunit
MAAMIVGVAVVIGVLSAAVPAWFASRRSVVESMRFTG